MTPKQRRVDVDFILISKEESTTRNQGPFSHVKDNNLTVFRGLHMCLGRYREMDIEREFPTLSE
jgi:hypothetical protein